MKKITRIDPSYILALGAIQVFDLDTKAKVASCTVDFEPIFWTWINDSTIAMVANDFVYKWSYIQNPESVPEAWFEKSESLDECQIINIQCDLAVQWCLLTGIQLKVSCSAFALLLNKNHF